MYSSKFKRKVWIRFVFSFYDSELCISSSLWLRWNFLKHHDEILKNIKTSQIIWQKFGPKLVSNDEAASEGIKDHIKSKSSRMQSVG